LESAKLQKLIEPIQIVLVFLTTGRKLCKLIFDRGLFAPCSESSSGIHYISAIKNRLQ
jgi:hypothetical protein